MTRKLQVQLLHGSVLKFHGSFLHSPLSLLAAQSGQVTKSIIKQLSSTKSLLLRLAGFQLLYQLTLVLQGGMESNLTTLIPVLEAVMKSGESGAAAGTAGGSLTSLKIQVFAFLALLFKTHQLRALQPSLAKLVPLIVSSIADRSPKIGAAALGASIELMRLLRPATPQSPAAVSSTGPLVKQIYDATTKCLENSNADQEIREKGIICLGDILASAAGDLGSDVQTGLQILKDRLRNENTRLITLITICRIAESAASTVSDDPFAPFMQETAFEVGDYLRKSNKPVQAASFVCLEAILKREGNALPLKGCQALIKNLQSSIANPDIHLSRSLNCLSIILSAHRDTLSTVEEEVLPTLLQLISAPSQITTTASESLLKFFFALVNAGADAQTLVSQLWEVAAKSSGQIQIIVNVSRCIGSVQQAATQRDASQAARIVDLITKHVSVGLVHLRARTLLDTDIGFEGKERRAVDYLLGIISNWRNWPDSASIVYTVHLALR